MRAVLRLFPNISPKARIALGLSSITVCLLLVAGITNLLPNREALLMQGRAALAESVAVNTSVFITRSELTRMESNLRAQLQRHPDLRSAGLRRLDGYLQASAGDHAQLWQTLEEGKSRNGQISVPIWEGEENWGQLELNFVPTRPDSWYGYLYDPFVHLLMFTGILSFIFFYFYLGKMLAHLDPSQAIPDRVRSALDTMAEGLLVLDAKKNIVLANEAFARLVEIPANSLLGVKASKFQWLPDGNDENSIISFPWDVALRDNCVQMGRIIRLALINRPPRTFMVNCSPVIGGGGKAAGVMVSFDDVTELEEKEIELRKSKEAAEAASRAKSDFLANMSHEIRTPMNAILGFTEVLKRGGGKSREESARYLNTIASSGEHLLGLINDILDLSKVEAGQLEVEQIDTPLHHIIHEVIQIMRVKANEKQLELRYQPHGPLPEKIISDPARVRQILTNLIGNAIKFTEAGSVTVHTQLQQQGTEAFIKLEVRDTGIGMTQAQADAIFQPFVQADSSITRRFGGTGLGLTISKRFAEALGAGISVQSEPGQGSTFAVQLKCGSLADVRQMSEAELQEQRAEEDAGVHVQWEFPAARVLVVDDGAENRNLLEVVLGDVGLQVDLAENGEEACTAVFNNEYDLVLMDVQMPIMDGYTAVGVMRENGITIPVVALTAHAMSGARERCLARGYSGYMSKPIDIEELMALLAMELGGEALEAVEDQPPVALTPAATEPAAAAPVAEQRPLASSLPMGNARFRAIVERFSKRLGEQVPHMKQALANGDLQQLAELAHWLKGSAGTVGFADFTQPAASLETAARSGERSQLDALQQQINELAARVELWASQLPEVTGSPTKTKVSVGSQATPASVTRLGDRIPKSIRSSLAHSAKFHPVIEKFQKRLLQKAAELDTSVRDKKYEQICEIAHWLKGSAGSVGYSQFTEPAMALEQAARERDALSVDNAYRTVALMVERVEPLNAPNERAQ